MSKRKNKKTGVFGLISNIKSTITDSNKTILDTVEEMVEATITRAGQWQLVGEKAINGGLKISAKNQDLVFDTLETIKSHVKKGRKATK